MAAKDLRLLLRELSATRSLRKVYVAVPIELRRMGTCLAWFTSLAVK